LGTPWWKALCDSQRSASTVLLLLFVWVVVYLVQLQEVTTDRASMQLRPAYANCQQRLLPHRVAGGKQFAVLCAISLSFLPLCIFIIIIIILVFYFIFGVTPQRHEGGCWRARGGSDMN
jgi:hypothetical protein